MTITKELILSRLVNLKASLDQAIANANACSGAIKECEHLLELLDKPEAEIKA